MAHLGTLIATDIEGYLDAHQKKGLLRFITCGSVDDGKSTLIGRMLYESHLVFEDHLQALAVDSKTVGTQGGELDLALLLDGLQAEREQGITIDVAYRFFSTERRKFIVADTPGHEEYTRNMITGGSTADLAVILVDARKGVITQTRRHSYLVSLLGIRNVVLAVNKMDLIDYDQSVFDAIVADYTEFAARIGLGGVVPIPLSALLGDNVVARSEHLGWFEGPTLFEHLETVPLAVQVSEDFRMPVQWVNRPNLDFRGVSGLIASGAVNVGDEVWVAPRGARAIVDRIVTFDGDLASAVAGQSVTITFDREIDASRGDLLSSVDAPVEISDRLNTHMVWMAEQPLVAGRPYLVKIGTRTVGAVFDEPSYRVNINTLEHEVAEEVAMNEIARIDVQLDRTIAFDRYDENRHTGGFIVIDRLTNATVGAGLIVSSADRSVDVRWHASAIDRLVRAGVNGHRPAVVWLTGLSGSGKSTLANLVERKLHARGVRTYVLDGDNLRHGLNSDLGFSNEDRSENIRRAAEVAALMADAGLVVISALISPFESDRRMARAKVTAGEFFEVFVDAPLAVAEGRDPKGLYAKARRGELKGMTGIDSPYDTPLSPDLHLYTDSVGPEGAADQIVALLVAHGVIDG
jgi:bifunctional enzyme CysN/CysC